MSARTHRAPLALLVGFVLACGGGGSKPVEVPVQTTEVPMSDPTTPRGRYEAWLAARGLSGPVQQATLQNAGEWSFFYLDGRMGPGAKHAAVAADLVVAQGQPQGWKTLLKSAEIAVIHDRVAWLHPMWGTLAPGKPSADYVLKQYPAAAPLLQAPLLTETDGTVTFRAWFVEPPEETPFRFTIHATDTTATFTYEALHQIAGP